MPQDPETARRVVGQGTNGAWSAAQPAAQESDRLRRWALILLFIAPAMFASNMLVARATHDLIAPIGLAFWRWTVALAILLPFTVGTLFAHRQTIRREWRDLLILGALGMGVCGAFVYIAADTTTATNIGLIYTASPILIVVLGLVFYHDVLRPLQSLGVALSLIGVLVVVSKGDPQVMLTLDLTQGDLWAVAAMIGWAVYSVMLNYRKSALPALARFAALTAGGVVILLPFTIWESTQVDTLALNWVTVGTVVFLALVPALGAYLSYGFIQRQLGAGPTGLLMYLIPLYNAGLAYVLLGEQLAWYHLAGILLILPGIYLANRRLKSPPA